MRIELEHLINLFINEINVNCNFTFQGLHLRMNLFIIIGGFLYNAKKINKYTIIFSFII